MKNIKRRLLSIVLAVAMVLGIIPGMELPAVGSTNIKEDLALEKELTIKEEIKSEKERELEEYSTSLEKDPLPRGEDLGEGGKDILAMGKNPLAVANNTGAREEEIFNSEDKPLLLARNQMDRADGLPLGMNNVMSLANNNSKGINDDLAAQNLVPVYNEKILDLIMKDYVTPEKAYKATDAIGSIGPIFEWVQPPRYDQSHLLHENFFPANIALFYNSRIMGGKRVNENYTYEEIPYTNRKLDWLDNIRDNVNSKSNPVIARIGASFPNFQEYSSSLKVLAQTYYSTRDWFVYKSLSSEDVGAKGHIDMDAGKLLRHRNYLIRVGGGTYHDTLIENPWITLIDNTSPTVTDAKLDGQKLTFTISENLRYANDKNKESFEGMVLNLATFDKRIKVEKPLQAKFTGFSDKEIYFEVVDNLQDVEYQITRIQSVDFKYKDNDFDVYGIMAGNNVMEIDWSKGEWVEKNYNNQIKKMTTIENAVNSPLTDVAGNAFKMPTDEDLRAYNLVVDTLSPKVKTINISKSETSYVSEVKDPNGEIELKDLFIGPNQLLNISVETDEEVSSKAFVGSLNIKNKDDEQVLIRDDSNKSYMNTTHLTFQPLEIEKGMHTTDAIYDDNGELESGGIIHPISIKAAEIKIGDLIQENYIKDKAGNELNITGLKNLLPEREMYLDTTAPNIEITPIGAKGRDLTYKLELSDEHKSDDKHKEPVYSGFTKRLDNASLVVGGKKHIYSGFYVSRKEDPNTSFQYIVTGDVNPPEGEFEEVKDKYAFGTTDLGGEEKWFDFSADKETLYLHLRIIDDQNTMEYINIEMTLEDLVGNKGRRKSENWEYNFDLIKPTILLKSMEAIYAQSTAKVEARVKVDDLTLKDTKLELKYYWGEEDETYNWENIKPITIPLDQIEKDKEITIESGTYNEEKKATLNILVKDQSGNTQKLSKSIDLFLDKPKATYVFESDSNDPDSNPKLTIKGPSVEEGNRAQTRINLIAGDDKYVRIVENGETLDLFDFTNADNWYKVEFRFNTHYDKVEPGLTLKDYYGPVEISLENVITKNDITPAGSVDLTPVVDAKIDDEDIENGSYNIENIGSVKYAPLQEGVHGITDIKYKDNNGDDLIEDDNGNIVLKESMSGTSISFDIENKKHSPWDKENIDFEKSYMAFVDLEGNELIKSDLTSVGRQTFTIPSKYSKEILNDENNPEDTEKPDEDNRISFEAGGYKLNVYIVQKGKNSEAGDKSESATIILDSAEPELENSGLLGYTHTVKYGGVSETITKQEAGGNPIDSTMTVSFKEASETMRNGLYSIESVGVKSTELIIGLKEKSKNIEGTLIGEVEGIRAWNIKTKGWENLEFTYDNKHFYGKPTRKYTIDSIVESLDDLEADGSLPLTRGENIIHYQFKMKNGEISPAQEFRVFVNDRTPEVTMSISPEISSDQYLKDKDPKAPSLIYSADLQLTKAISANGQVRTSLLRKGPFIQRVALVENDENNDENNGKYKDEYNKGYVGSIHEYPYSMGDENKEADIIKVWSYEDDGKTYKDNFTTPGGDVNNNNKENLTTIFSVVDDAGGMTLIIPQFKADSYTDPNYLNEGEKYTRYALEATMKGDFEGGSNSPLYWKEETNNLDFSRSSFTFFGEGLPKEGLNLPVENPPLPNAAGYVGLTDDGEGYGLKFKMGRWFLETEDNFRDSLQRNVIFHSVSKHGQEVDYNLEDSKIIYGDDIIDRSLNAESMNKSNLEYTNISINPDHPGVQLEFPENDYLGDIELKLVAGSSKYSNTHILPIYSNGDYTVRFMDVLGNEFDYTFTVDFEEFKNGPEISISNTELTTKPVIVTFTDEKDAFTVSGEDGKAEISGNGTNTVTAIVSDSSKLTVRWGEDKERIVAINNIQPLNPKDFWGYNKDESLDKNRVIGYVNVILKDENWKLIDVNTGEAPKYTFYPNGETSHIFYVTNGEEGAETIEKTVSLPKDIDLIERPVYEEEEPDNLAPLMQLRAYSDISGNGNLEDQEKILRANNVPKEIYELLYKTYIKEYNIDEEDAADEEYDIYYSSNSFLSSLGGGERYRFLIDTIDNSPVKIIVKKGINAEKPEYGDSSDSISGVTLIRGSLTVIENASFTLFAVDALNNSTSINMVITNIAKARAPKLKKLVVGSGEDRTVRVYLIPTDTGEFKELKLTDLGAKEESDGEDKGRWFMDYKDNGKHTLHYSYKDQGRIIQGSLAVTVDGFDKEVITRVGPIIWSENKDYPTNKDIIAKLEFSSNLREVTSNRIGGVEILFSGKNVTVRYLQNSDPLKLTCTAENGMTTIVDLEEVDNIDKTPPIITQGEVVINPQGGASASVKFTSEEQVTLQGGQREEERFKNKFDLVFKEEGSYNYQFMDSAGNVTISSVTIAGLIKEPLNLSFSLNEDGSDKKEDPSEITGLKLGSIIYVKANRKCKIRLNKLEEKEYEDEWIGFEITEDMNGLTPTIYAIDPYNNSAIAQLREIDTMPPFISLKSKTITTSFYTDKEDLREILNANLSVRDDKDDNPKIEVSFDKPKTPGIVYVNYIARDYSGNESSTKGNLRLLEGEDLKVTLNGEHVERDGISSVGLEEFKLKVDMGMEQAYSVTYRSGDKSLGQMKNWATDLVRNATNSDEITLPFYKKGYYTVCIVTQGRDYFCFLINVK